jgi:hypothetical protein
MQLDGTTCGFWKLVLNLGAKLAKIQMYRCGVYTISMEAVEYMEVTWQDCDHFHGNFQLTPKVGTFRVKYPVSEFRLHTNPNKH